MCQGTCGVVGPAIKRRDEDSRTSLERAAAAGESPLGEIGVAGEPAPEYRGARGILRESAGPIP